MIIEAERMIEEAETGIVRDLKLIFKTKTRLHKHNVLDKSIYSVSLLKTIIKSL